MNVTHLKTKGKTLRSLICCLNRSTFYVFGNAHRAQTVLLTLLTVWGENKGQTSSKDDPNLSTEQWAADLGNVKGVRTLDPEGEKKEFRVQKK